MTAIDPLIQTPSRAMELRDRAVEGELLDAAAFAEWKRKRKDFEAWQRGERKPLRKKNKDRNENDAYMTPLPLAISVCEWLAKRIPSPVRVLEPCVGGGAFYKAIRSTWPNAIVGVEDIDRSCLGVIPAHRKGGPGSTGVDYSLSLTNPPFLIADRLVRTNMERVPMGGHVAFLLPVGFIATEEREQLYLQCPLRYYVPISPRPSFQADGSTAPTEYALYVFQRGYACNAEIVRPGIRWRKPGRAK